MSSAGADAGRLATANGAAATRRGPPDPLASVVLVLLVLACLGAFFLTQRLKHTPTAVQAFELTPVFSPHPGSSLEQEAISFKLKQADAVTVTIIDSEGDVVATLVRGHRLPRYKQFSLRWNGRRGVARRYPGHPHPERPAGARGAAVGAAREAGRLPRRNPPPRPAPHDPLAAQLLAGVTVSGGGPDARHQAAVDRGAAAVRRWRRSS